MSLGKLPTKTNEKSLVILKFIISSIINLIPRVSHLPALPVWENFSRARRWGTLVHRLPELFNINSVFLLSHRKTFLYPFSYRAFLPYTWTKAKLSINQFYKLLFNSTLGNNPQERKKNIQNMIKTNRDILKDTKASTLHMTTNIIHVTDIKLGAGNSDK